MKTYLTGIKPTHLPHIGNMLGAIKPAIDFSKNGKSEDRYLYFIADYHALTSVRDSEDFKEHVYEIAATWLALGLDPAKVIFYKQSDIPETFELAWILACNTPKGDLERAHAYKAAVQANKDAGKKDLNHGINAGLFNYPVLMAADILLFDCDIVPVGKDQVQHVEMARSMAQRINQHYGDVLVEPQESLSVGQYIPGLDGRKMSKSYGNTIPLFVPEKKLKKTINKITTDSKEPNEPKETKGSLIFDIYQCFASPSEVQEMKKKYLEGISWGEAKVELFEKVNAVLSEPREKYEYLMANREVIDCHLKEGAVKARKIAGETLDRVKQRVTGF
ncbi:MAG: tryptophan--tRNA ligase [Halobacteriovoraceae bacterium]|nr:tryptophan--tRNA ligase [Halobacteriovoraceae bacterium]MCB9095670.1 tryptophan--tRNA ligase [Halobacteriovoraceae bacterium]